MGEGAGSDSSMRGRERQIEALMEICTAISLCRNEADIAEALAGRMKAICGFQSLALYISSVEDGKLRFVPRLVLSPFEGQLRSAVECEEASLLKWSIEHMKPILLSDAGEVTLRKVVESENSSVTAPMVAGDTIVGALYVGDAEPYAYDECDCRCISIVASCCALAIRNLYLSQSIDGYENRDVVTGLYTHRYFQKRMLELCKEYERTLKPFSLMMIDVDHFMKYNDTLGHNEGDKILREMAALIMSYTRDTDIVCRYGGDEFAVILKDSDKENSIRNAERIREAFQYRFHTYPVKITASIGVAGYPEDAASKFDLVIAAETALYRSKKGGRNQVNYAPRLKQGEDPPEPGNNRPFGPPFPSNVPVTGRPSGISCGNECEIPDDSRDSSADDSDQSQ